MHNSFWGTLYILTTQICISRYIDRVMVLVHTIKQQHNVRKIGSRDHNKNSQFAQQKIKSPTPQTCLLLPACVVVPLSPVPNSSWILSRFSMCTKKNLRKVLPALYVDWPAVKWRAPLLPACYGPTHLHYSLNWKIYCKVTKNLENIIMMEHYVLKLKEKKWNLKCVFLFRGYLHDSLKWFKINLSEYIFITLAMFTSDTTNCLKKNSK